MPSRTYTLAELQALADNFLRYRKKVAEMRGTASMPAPASHVLATFLAFVEDSSSEMAETEVVRQRRYV